MCLKPHATWFQASHVSLKSNFYDSIRKSQHLRGLGDHTHQLTSDFDVKCKLIVGDWWDFINWAFSAPNQLEKQTQKSV